MTTYAISAYHHKRCEFESRSGGVDVLRTFTTTDEIRQTCLLHIYFNVEEISGCAT